MDADRPVTFDEAGVLSGPVDVEPRGRVVLARRGSEPGTLRVVHKLYRVQCHCRAGLHVAATHNTTYYISQLPLEHVVVLLSSYICSYTLL